MPATAKETQLVSNICKGCDCNGHTYQDSRLQNFNCGSTKGNTPKSTEELRSLTVYNRGQCPLKSTRCQSTESPIQPNYKIQDLVKAMGILACTACTHNQDRTEADPCDIYNPKNIISMKRNGGSCPDHSSRGNKVSTRRR